MYLFVTIIIATILSLLAYYLYLRQKGEKLDYIEQGFCPECKKKSIEVKRLREGGCSGTSNVIYQCDSCGYEEEFNVIRGGGCGI